MTSLARQKPVGIGLIGVGAMGAYHADNLAFRVAGARLVSIADMAPGRAEQEASKYPGVKWTTDADDLLADPEVEAVVIVTRPPDHVDRIAAAASAGKAIFCEKPLTNDLPEADRAIKVVADAGVILQIGCQRRYDPDYKKTRQMIANGELGQIELMRSITRGRTLDNPANVAAWNLFRGGLIHDFDAMRYLCGAEPVEVFAMGEVLVVPDWKDQVAIDTAVVTLRFDSGALATFDCNLHCLYGFDVRAEIYGRNGMVTLGEGAPNKIVHHTEQGSVFKKSNYFADLFKQAYIDELEEFAECVRSGEKPICTGEDGKAALAVALAAIESVRTGKPQKVGEVLYA